ncbi:diaminopimelate decarboxylase [Salmonella enterica]|nr:diaminopimelate decarboxylase [Salmonella enterica]
MNFPQNIISFCKDTETPFYIYSEEYICNRVNYLKEIFSEPEYTLLYAIKANSNPQIIKLIVCSGFGVDVCSVEEIKIAALCGVASEDIFYNADCLTAAEINMAIRTKVNITVGSLDALRIIAKNHPGTCISLRFNTGVGVGHSEKVITNGELSKFGILISDLKEAISICKYASVIIEGIHSHTGSGEMDITGYIENARVMAELAKGFPTLKFINFGGGFGYDYITHNAYDINAIHDALNDLRVRFGFDNRTKFIIEPGRYVVAGSGMLFSRVTSVKTTASRNFIGLDTGYNHFPRCFYYDAWHDIENVSADQYEKKAYDITGYLCQSGDIFARQRMLPETKVGDLICIKDVGAYGFSMSSQFNSRVRPAEYLVKINGEIKIIRRGENFEDIISTCVLD